MAKKEKTLYDHLPTCPGVYLMKNDAGMIVYIGKSNSLRSRVRSYFVPKAELNFAKKKMVKLIKKIEYIETKTDVEALMLETNLIKEHQPKYNVLMKDGKNLSYLKITTDQIPCLIRTRIKNSYGEYFGPYSQYFDTRNYLRFIRKLFRLGNHDKIELKKDKLMPPCMDTYLGICPGHCTGNPEKIQIYLDRLKDAREFLNGKHDDVVETLKSKMQQAAKDHEFEEASNYKYMIEQIEATGNTQIVRDVIEGNALVIVGLEKYDRIFLSLVEIKNAMIIGVHEYILENPLEDTLDVLIAKASLQYLATNETRQIYTDVKLELSDEFKEYAQERKIKIMHPSRGEKVRLLEFAHTNLLNFAYRETMENLKQATLSRNTMLDLMETIGVEIKSEKRTSKDEMVFECFDISHSHGEHTVASKSVLVNGKPEPKRYRKYRIKTLGTGTIDDFASIDEILTRRSLGALRGEDSWPDLVIIDGGKGQLSHAVEAMKNIAQRLEEESGNEIDFAGTLPPVISLAKRIEEVFLPGQSEPILLEKGSAELMLLQKIRDEAHRFAINYNRSSREKSYTKTIFDEIPGIGPVGRKKIFSHISRAEELASWDYEKAKKTFGKNIAEALQNHGLIQ